MRIPDDIRVLIVLQLLEEGYFTNGTHWHALLCILYLNAFDGHPASFVTRVLGLKHSSIRPVPDDVNFFIVVVILFFV